MENDWSDIIITYNYNIKCDICKNEFVIVQKYCKLNSNILKKVLEKLHINAIYDACIFYEGDIKVDCEIIGNKKCL